MILNINNCNPRTQRVPEKLKTLPPVEKAEKTIHDVPDSWKYLTRATKDALTIITVEGMMRLLQMGAYTSFYNTYNTLSRLKEDGWVMTDDQEQVLAMPERLWGVRALQVLREMRTAFLEERKTHPPKKKRRTMRYMGCPT